MLLKKSIFLTAILMLVLLVTTISCAQTAPRTTATSPTVQASTTTQAAMTTTAKPSPTTSASPSPTTTTQTTTAPTTTPQYGGVLKIITPASPVNLGLPSAATGMDDSFSRRCCAESLVGFDNKGKLIPVPLLATGWQISPDYKTVTLTLRQGVKFHDGTDFNAEAAKFNLDMYRQAKSASPLMKSMTSVDIVDDYTIRLNLSTYQPTILTGVQGPGQSLIFSPTALKTMGDQCLTHPVGTGPFKFVSYTRDVSLEFARFDSYWQKGKPYLNGIKWLFIVDPMTSLAAFKAGDGDVLREVTAKDASALKATGKYNISMVPKTVEGLISDGAHAGSPFSDIRVRRAISYAIDNDALVKMLSYGFNSPANQLAPPSGPFYNPAVVGYPYNPQKAKELLSQAGYPTGFKTTLMFRQVPGASDVYTSIQSYLSAVGIDVKLDAADTARFTVARAKGWDSGFLGFSIASSPEEDELQWLNDRVSDHGSMYPSTTVYIPADYNAKLLAASAEQDTEKRTAMIQELGKMIIDDYCLVNPVYLNNGLTAKSSQVHDLDLHEHYWTSWYPENAWLSK